MHLQFFSPFYSGTLLAMALEVIAHPLHSQTAVVLQTRDLIGGILGDTFEPVVAASDINTVGNLQTATAEGSFPVQTSILTSASRVLTTVSTGTTTPSQTTTSITQTTTNRSSETSNAESPSTTSIQIGYVADAPVTPPGEATEWKVIGIAVISIAFISIVVLAVTFFDSWWGFLRAIFLGNKHNGGDEKLVPDWDKRSWEYNLSIEDGHRYPTMASLESIVKTPEKSAGVNSSPSVTRLSQHDVSHCGLTDSYPRTQQLVREASLRMAGIRS
jgi:hypothetical protein